MQVQVANIAVKPRIVEPKKRPGKWSLVRPHCLRKLYQTNLERVLPDLALDHARIELAARWETIEELKTRLERPEAVSIERLIRASNPRGGPGKVWAPLTICYALARCE